MGWKATLGLLSVFATPLAGQTIQDTPCSQAVSSYLHKRTIDEKMTYLATDSVAVCPSHTIYRIIHDSTLSVAGLFAAKASDEPVVEFSRGVSVAYDSMDVSFMAGRFRGKWEEQRYANTGFGVQLTPRGPFGSERLPGGYVLVSIAGRASPELRSRVADAAARVLANTVSGQLIAQTIRETTNK